MVLDQAGRAARSKKALLLLLLLLAGLVGLLRPPFLRFTALRIMESRYGVRLRLLDAQPRGLLEGINLNGLQLIAASAPPDTVYPLFSANHLRVEGGLLEGVTRPATPGLVTIAGARLRLDFSAGSKLLTPLPQVREDREPGPAIAIRGWHLELCQEGRMPWIVGGADLTLKPSGHGYSLDGTLTDARYGDWLVTGEIESHPPCLRLQLTSAKARLDPETLQAIPIVPLEVWRQVSLCGAGEVTLELNCQPRSATYRLGINADDLEVGVPIAGVLARHVAGSALVDNGVVTLDRIRGDCWGGQLRVADAILDFKQNPAHLLLHLQAEGIQLAAVLNQPWAKEPASRPGLQGMVRGHGTGQVSLGVRLEKPMPVWLVEGAGQAEMPLGLNLDWQLKTLAGKVRLEPGKASLRRPVPRPGITPMTHPGKTPQSTAPSSHGLPP